jgi:formate dehydrogenase iron-sulfur subunit
MSYDNTVSLNANTWRHVAFVEQPAGRSSSGGTVDLGMPGPPPPTSPDGAEAGEERPDFRWLMSSDVCKHCTHAACLDVCPTGSLFRTEFGTVVVQPDICNGCGYCVPACPYGVIERRTGPEGARNVGIAQKCTLCYDRIGDGQRPACAQACPTESIQYGDVDELRERAAARVAQLHEAGVMDARLYGADPDDGVGGAGAFFLLLDEPEVYGLPPDPVVTTRDLPHMFRRATAAAVTLMVGAAVAFAGRRS